MPASADPRGQRHSYYDNAYHRKKQMPDPEDNDARTTIFVDEGRFSMKKWALYTYHDNSCICHGVTLNGIETIKPVIFQCVATSILEADKLFEQETGEKPEKNKFCGASWEYFLADEEECPDCFGTGCSCGGIGLTHYSDEPCCITCRGQRP